MAILNLLSSRRALDAVLATVAVGVFVLIALPQMAETTDPGAVPLSRQFERQHADAKETMRRVVRNDEARSWLVIDDDLVSLWTRRGEGEPFAEFLRRHADLLSTRGAWTTTVERELWADLMESLEAAAADPDLQPSRPDAAHAPARIRMRISRGGLHVIPAHGSDPAAEHAADDLVLDQVFPPGP